MSLEHYKGWYYKILWVLEVFAPTSSDGGLEGQVCAARARSDW
jgi:hypothetical protein